MVRLLRCLKLLSLVFLTYWNSFVLPVDITMEILIYLQLDYTTNSASIKNSAFIWAVEQNVRTLALEISACAKLDITMRMSCSFVFLTEVSELIQAGNVKEFCSHVSNNNFNINRIDSSSISWSIRSSCHHGIASLLGCEWGSRPPDMEVSCEYIV